MYRKERNDGRIPISIDLDTVRAQQTTQAKSTWTIEAQWNISRSTFQAMSGEGQFSAHELSSWLKSSLANDNERKESNECFEIKYS